MAAEEDGDKEGSAEETGRRGRVPVPAKSCGSDISQNRQQHRLPSERRLRPRRWLW